MDPTEQQEQQQDNQQQPEPPIDVAAEALAAMDEGLAVEAGEEPAKEQAKEPEAKAVPVAKTEDAAKTEQKPEPTADEEVASFNLKGRTAERFRELSAVKAEYEPVRALLAAEGIKPDQLKTIVDRHKDAEFVISEVNRRVGDSQTFDNLLGYGEAVRAARGGDVEAARKALQMAKEEVAALAKIVGEPVPGIHDPLAGHQDLLDEVESGAMSRARAEELAGARDSRKHVDTARQTQQQAHTQQEQLVALQNAANGRIQALHNAWKADPVYLASIFPQLTAHVTRIQQTRPPSEWEAETMAAYNMLKAVVPAPVAAPATPRAGPVPVRGTGSRPPLVPNNATALEALEQGLMAASQ